MFTGGTGVLPMAICLEGRVAIESPGSWVDYGQTTQNVMLNFLDMFLHARKKITISFDSFRKDTKDDHLYW